MKILVLSCNTGQGHNTAGRAILEAMLERGLDCRMVDALSFGRRCTSGLISGAYIKLAKNAPAVFGYLYQAGSLISTHTRRSPVYLANALYASSLLRYIEEHQIDTVICSHLFPAETLTRLRRRRLLTATCYAVATDYTCVPFWEELDMDAHFIPHPDLIKEYEMRGIAAEKLVGIGIPVSKTFQSRLAQAEARAHLNLDMDKKIFLVMTGSMGFGDVLPLPESILQEGGNDTQVIVLTGQNEKLRQQLCTRYPREEQVLVISFTQEVSLYMDACDVILTKPGGLSSTEAAAKRIPLVHTMPIPGCETKNANFFSHRNMSVYTKSPRESARAACALSQNQMWQADMQKAQAMFINTRAAEDICDFILSRSKNERRY